MKLTSHFQNLVRTALFVAAAALQPVMAQDWQPNAAIKLVVPYPPGGGTDVVARLMVASVGEALGKPMIIENRPGANGVVGANAVFLNKPDGQTLLFGVADIISTTPYVNPKPVTFNPDGFSAVAPVATGGYVLIARKENKNSDVAMVVAAAKEPGASPTYAHWGAGSMSQMAMELLKLQAGMPSMRAIPYAGSAPTLNAVLAGQVDYAFVPPGLAAANQASLRIYAISSAERIPLLKETPTLKEKGFNIVADTWYGVVAPPETPKHVVEAINKAINKSTASPTFAARLLDMGYVPMSSDPAKFNSYIKAENKKWGNVVKDANLKIEQ